MKEVVPISGPYHMVTFEEGNAMKCETADHKMDASDFVLHQLIHLIRGCVFVRRFVELVGFFFKFVNFRSPSLDPREDPWYLVQNNRFSPRSKTQLP